MLTMDELRADVDAGRVDTVVMAITDMQGRLQGKRLDAGAFVREIAEHGAEGCHYLLAVDIDMNTLPGFAMSGWDSRLRRLRVPPRPRHAAPLHVARGHRDGAGRHRVARRQRRSRRRRARS